MTPNTGPGQTIIIESRSNGLGTAGFVVSLLGFLTCGLICPLGMLLSFFGVFSRPRGLAIAGFVLGVIGSFWLWLAGLGIVLGTLGLGAAGASAARDAAEKAKQQSVSEQPAAEQQEQQLRDDLPAVPEAAAEPEVSPDISAIPPAISDAPAPEPVIEQPQANQADQPQHREMRTWSDASGKFSVTARLKSVRSGSAKLVKEDGSEISVPIDRLSEDDQAYIKDQMSR